MARFAHQPGVLAFGLDFGLIHVRGLARFSAGELDRPGTDVVDGRRLEMPAFTGVRRNPAPGAPEQNSVHLPVRNSAQIRDSVT
jgi:hypothetical protein